MEIKYRLHINQLRVFNDNARFVVLVAGRRFGKTTLALIKLITTVFAKENSRAWYVSPSYRQSEMIAWKMLQNLLPPEIIIKKDETRLEMILIGNREIALKGADNPESLKGTGLEYAVLDEYAYIKQNVWEEVIRPMLTDTKGGALFIGTPQGKNNLWRLWLKGQRHETGFSSYQFKTVDNPFIDPKEIEEAKTQVNERYFRQEYEASFEDYTGLIYPEFNHKSHVVEPFYIDKMFPRTGAIDPAISGTTAALKAMIDEDGALTIYEEYYQANKRVSEITPDIKEDGVSWFIDPASSSKNIQREGKLYALYDEYADQGLYARPAEHDVDSGINRVAEYFKQNKIRIFSTCKNLINELETYHWSEERETVAGVLKPRPYKSMDHAVDCLRYIVMSRPVNAKIIITPEIKRGSVAYEMELIEKEQNDWKAKYR